MPLIAHRVRVTIRAALLHHPCPRVSGTERARRGAKGLPARQAATPARGLHSRHGRRYAMSDRERSPSIGDWDDAAAGSEGDDDGSEAGLAGLGTPLANSRI